MKYMKSYILFALMGWAVTSCTLNDLKDDVDNLKDRVTLIEQQVKLLNDNLAVAGFVLDPQNKLITDVKEKDGQFVIELTNGDKLNLTIGKPGTVNEPVITIEDGYWVINGVKTNVKAAGENGKNGEGFPEFRVEAGKWQVRFGEGAWTDVQGGTIEGITGSLGDQIFESAKVEGKNFVVTLKDGNKVITLPIVEKLACAIDETNLSLEKGFLVVEKGTRVLVPVKVNGDNVQVTYPQGWRATISQMSTPDEKGNNYQLAIFAPSADSKTITRALADNMADVCVLVQKGNFWAVDKIKVKTPKDYSNNLVKYEDGLAVTVGGLEITKNTYGKATEINSDQEITEGGVYFVSVDNVKLTYNLGATGVENLILLPATKDVETIHLAVNKQIYVKGTLALQNVEFNSSVDHYPLRLMQSELVLNVAIDNCDITGLKASKGLAMKGDAALVNIFAISNSNIKLSDSGNGLYLLTQVPCNKLIVNNNVIYTDDQTTVKEFKVYNGNANNVECLDLISNTFIDIESSGASVYGLVRAAKVNQATVENNVYWLTAAEKAAYFFTGEQAVVATLKNSGNVGYSVSGKPLRMFQKTALEVDVDLVEDLFDIKDSKSFNKETGVFVPKAGYTQFGAQR